MVRGSRVLVDGPFLLIEPVRIMFEFCNLDRAVKTVVLCRLYAGISSEISEILSQSAS